MDVPLPNTPHSLAAVDARTVRTAIACGALNVDATFDQLYPAWAQRLSRFRWTPVEVAKRAAALLGGDGLYLDVGSGVGKFCLVAALVADGRFVGIERRVDCAAAAIDAARGLELGGRCEFIAGDAFALEWGRFDGVYLFNPFLESLYAPLESAGVWRTQTEAVRATRQQLLQLSRGARVVTFCGFGGPFPPGFERAHTERRGGGELELWVRTG